MLLIKSFFQTDEYLVTFEQNHIFKKIDAANQDRWIFFNEQSLLSSTGPTTWIVLTLSLILCASWQKSIDKIWGMRKSKLKQNIDCIC